MLSDLLTLTFAGIGTHKFFAITFRRQEPEQMLLVTDRMGRIRHVTRALAKLLDSTPEGLQVILPTSRTPTCLSLYCMADADTIPAIVG